MGIQHQRCQGSQKCVKSFDKEEVKKWGFNIMGAKESRELPLFNVKPLR